MAELAWLPTRRDWFPDARDGDRRMQVTWHAAERIVVLSVWHGARCTASVQLPVEEAGRLIALLAGSLGEAAADGAQPAPAGAPAAGQ